MTATVPARASWRLQRARRGGLAGTGIRRRRCGDLLADKATQFDVAGTAMHGRESELGQHHQDSRAGLSLPRRLWPFRL